jgi:PEGA domain
VRHSGADISLEKGEFAVKRFAVVALMLLMVAGPSFGKTHSDMYSVPCSVLWTAVKDALRNSGKYGILGIDNTEMTASFVIGGSLGGKRINSVVLNVKGDTCEMQTQTAFSGLAHNDAGDFKKRVDESLAKQPASPPAKPESTAPAEKTDRTAPPVPATEPPKAAPESPSEGTATVAVTSTPDGAEISVDGTFVGSTPANLKLSPGKHTIRITQSDYKDWSREIGVQAGSETRIVATLDKK